MRTQLINKRSSCLKEHLEAVAGLRAGMAACSWAADMLS